MPSFDNTQAMAEGWAISEVGAVDDMYRLEKLDEADAFPTDQDAWTFVANRALGGSRYHITALKYLEANDCADFKLIENHVGQVSHLFVQLVTPPT